MSKLLSILNNKTEKYFYFHHNFVKTLIEKYFILNNSKSDYYPSQTALQPLVV